ncbi:PAS domain-containing sensor histidine kinase, partial [Stenotrophomonas maltophilia]
VLRPALEQAARVHESEALSRTLIETSPVGLCLLDQQSGQLILHNQALEQLAGGTVPGLASVVQRLVQDVGAPEPGQPFAVAAADGTTPPRFLRAIVAPSRYQRRAIWVCAVTDVTAQEETRQRLLDARHAAEAADQAKSAFVAMISHEIRTPLSGVLGHLELLARQPMSASAQTHTARARSAAGVLQGLVDDTLDLSRMDAVLMQLQPVAFDPRGLLQQT